MSFSVLFSISKFSDLIHLIESIGNDGITHSIKEDLHGNIPKPTKQTSGFGFVDSSLGTILSILEMGNPNLYQEAKNILESKGYEIIELKRNIIFLDSLV